jgi:hypothetical protein
MPLALSCPITTTSNAKTTPPSQFLLKVPHMLLLQGAIVIKIGEETGGRALQVLA